MNRLDYFNFIESRLSLLAMRLEMRGGLNILDMNLHAEDFYLHFFNLLFGWELKNQNTVRSNAAGVDLIDDTNKIMIQVSATATKQKIESALAKDLSACKGYSFKFISIVRDASKLRAMIYANPHNILFSPPDDIYDIPSLLKLILAMNIERQKEIYEFLKKELKSEPDPEMVESNLAAIIDILSKEDWRKGKPHIDIIPYDIEDKISYNRLNDARVLIDDYKLHYARIDKIYSEYDKQGVNRSLSVLDAIRTEYVTLCSAASPDECFFSIIDKVILMIRKSANYTPIPDEELALCVGILVVDAFIRCKIFKNPLGTSDAHS